MSEAIEDALRAGERFHGYVVQKLLGKGSSGAVYLVHHEVLDTLYALKILGLSQQPEDQSCVKRFLREARLASRIRHPNLVSVHDCGYDADRGLYYLVMDYVPGSSLRDSIAFEGRFSPERAVDVAAQVASALEAAQPYKVVHRDIKPENILVEPSGRVKLVDLGIAKAQDLGDSLETSTDSVFGTPSYISPEQAQCSADVDARADIYSLGVVLFEMLTGQCPYAGSNPMAIIGRILSDEEIPDVRDVTPGITPELAILVRRMTMKDRERRISTFGAVLSEIGKLGYGGVKPVAPVPEYAARPAPGMKTLLNGLGGCQDPPSDTCAEPGDGAHGISWDKTVTSMRRAPLRWLALAAVVLLAILAMALVVL